jgi:hypothetical protein
MSRLSLLAGQHGSGRDLRGSDVRKGGGVSEAIQRKELREAVDSTMADAEHVEINLYEDVPFTQGEAMYLR